MTDIGFSVAGLRDGAVGHRACADAATAVGTMLAAVAIEAGAFGGVPSAAPFASGAVAARDAQNRGVVAEAARRAELEGRARQTADIGELMVSLTTGAAQSAPAPFTPGGILEQLGPH